MGSTSCCTVYVWGDGDACVRVEHLKVNGGGHDWPGTFGNMDINSNEEIWNFVSQFDLNGLIDCNVSGLEGVDQKSAITVFPNPVMDYIVLEGLSSTRVPFTVYSSTGQKMLSGELAVGEREISTEQLEKGVYFIEVENQVVQFVKL